MKATGEIPTHTQTSYRTFLLFKRAMIGLPHSSPHGLKRKLSARARPRERHGDGVASSSCCLLLPPAHGRSSCPGHRQRLRFANQRYIYVSVIYI